MPYREYIEYYKQEIEYLINLDTVLQESCEFIDDYRRIINKSKILLIYTEFQRALRKILHKYISLWDSIDNAKKYDIFCKEYLAYLVKHRTHKNIIFTPENNYDFLVQYIDNKKINPEIYNTIMIKYQHDINYLPTSSWEGISKLMKLFYIDINIMKISLSINEDMLGVDITSQNQYLVKEVFESFIKIRDDYTHANKDDHEIANITIKHDEVDIELDNTQICIFFETLLENIARNLYIVNT